MLGIEPTTRWETRALSIASGDCLACWTDGITEAWGVDDDLFGSERLISLIERNSQRGSRKLVEAVKLALYEHASSRRFADDHTFLTGLLSLIGAARGDRGPNGRRTALAAADVALLEYFLSLLPWPISHSRRALSIVLRRPSSRADFLRNAQPVRGSTHCRLPEKRNFDKSKTDV